MAKSALAKLKATAGVLAYTEYPLLTDPEFKALVEEKIKLDHIRAMAEARLNEIKGNITAYMMGAGLPEDDEVVSLWDGYRLRLYHGQAASKLSVTKLISAGVTLEQIEAGTDEGAKYDYVQVEKPKVTRGSNITEMSKAGK